MKAYCILQRPVPNNNELCFTYTHMYQTLSKYIDCSLECSTDTTHLLFLDFGPSIHHLHEAKILRKQGIKVCVMVFDPPGFNYIDWFKSEQAIDTLILFDQKFIHDYPEAYISDHFFNESIFPLQTTSYEDKLCVFGRIDQHRPLPNGITKVDLNINSYSELYKNVMNYNGVYVFDTGGNRDWTQVTHYNKAKGVEALMNGRNAYCQEGINTIHYNKFLKSHFLYNKLEQVKFDQKEIFGLNKTVIENLIENII